LTADKKSLFSI